MTTPTPAVQFQNIGVRNGGFALNDVNLTIPKRNYTVLLGRTGSGKSTLLELLCGLRKAATGTILVDGVDVTHWDAASRGIGYVPQDGALFTAMTVRQQLELPLQVRRMASAQIRDRVDAIAAKLEVEHLLDRYPLNRSGGSTRRSGANGGGNSGGLSGGERQRVALARALIFEPAVLCLDEPLSSVDEDGRERLYPVLKSLVDEFHAAVLHVTHSRKEAQLLASQTLRLSEGKLLLQ